MGNLFYLDKKSQGLLDIRLRTWQFVRGDLRMRGNKTHAQRLRAWADTLVRRRSTWRAGRWRNGRRCFLLPLTDSWPGGESEGATIAEV